MAKRFAAEFLGTFLLMFASVGTVLQDAALGDAGFGLFGIALGTGVMLALAVTAMANLSGAHFNPAVSISFVLTGKLPVSQLPGYLVAQVAGAFLATLVLKMWFDPAVLAATGLATCVPAETLSFGRAVFIEVVLTFILVTIIWGTAVDPRRLAGIGGAGIGLIVFVNILIAGPLTGAAMNPARVLGPALASGIWTDHAVYWVGPLLGAIVAAFTWKLLFGEGDAAGADAAD